MTGLHTTVTFADEYTLEDFRALKYNFDNMLVRQCISIDPVTNILTVDIYTDDGQGNGNLLYRFDLT